MDLTTLTLTEATGKMRTGELSPVALTQAYLERIAVYNPRLNAYLTVTQEVALRQAGEAERAIRDGRPLGPLHGLPLAVKDLYETTGIRTTAGSKFFTDTVPGQDAAAVERLNAAGAVLLGKLNMHEIALGVTNDNPHFGPCRNPWDLERVSGGSSGGSAVALAARLCLGSLGSDTGGSIRIPSSLCGIVGLKPTYGRVSLRGVVPLSWSLDHPGPLGRCVEDVARLLQVVAGYDPLDPASVNLPVDDYLAGLKQGVRGWKVALACDEHFANADPAVLAAVREAAQVFTGLGAQVDEVEIPWGRIAAQANGLVVPAEAAAYHRQRLAEHPENFGEDVLRRLRTGQATPLEDYIQARRTQVECRRQAEGLFEKVDLLLTPATPIPAPLLVGDDAVERARQLTRFTAPFNLTGLPALALPCGFTAEGLPLGLQIVARPWNEMAVLMAGYAYERATEWQRRVSRLQLE